jgi:chemotaxis protein CheX
MAIPDTLLKTLISATEEVFETMVFVPIAVEPGPAVSPPGPHAHVVATIAFAGHRNGFVSFRASIDSANEIAGAMLGMPTDRVNGEMPDAIGEIANMIAGSFRTKMAAVEPAWTITCPSVTVGSDFSTRYPTGASHEKVSFRMGERSIAVELILSHR